MTRILDTKDGTLHLPNGSILRPGLSLDDATRLGLPFVRAIDLATGWSYRTTEPRSVDDHRVYFALGFHDRQLATVEFGFVDLSDKAGREQRQEYDSYLASQFGPPANTTVAATRYDFPWGKVTSYYDPRTDAAGMIVRWT
jgi:hypothetical protein